MNKSILIIEQDEPLGDEIIQSLKDNGYECTLFRQGTEGLNKIKEIHPDIIVLDDIYENALVPALTAAGISEIPTVFISPATDFNETINRALLEVKEKLSLGSPSASLSGKKILWVEDDKLIATILTKKFSAYGCNISLFKNGADALTYLEKQKPDVIVLDLLLPGMSGFDVLKKIRSNHTLDTVPVLILSNLNQPADTDKAKVMGAQKFLVKAAVSLDDIVKVVVELCNH
jgi:DNA-binding response OmpR family regulator